MKNKIVQRASWLAFGLALVPSLAQAHPGHSHFGLAHGFMHPLTGLDHMLAMVAVGLWAAQIGGRALWAAPLSFVTLMAAGSALGMGHAGIPFAEQGILASVFVLGLLIATAARLPLWASVMITGAFALCHGYAHGAEMPATASGLSYAAGFVLATALLHAAGIAMGLLIGRGAHPKLIRYAGGAIAIAGCAMAFGLITV